MTHRGPFQPLLFCDSMLSVLAEASQGQLQQIPPVWNLVAGFTSPTAL